jgi:hypothetical protein
MSITTQLSKDSPRVTADADNSQVELEYHIIGTLDPNDALNALIAAAPLTQTTDGTLLSHRTASLEPVGHTVWKGTMSYQKRSKERPELQTYESSYQFETGGESKRITHSLQTVQTVRPSGTPANFKNAIGVNGDQVEGCDIIVPTFTFSETHVLPPSLVTGGYKLALFRCTGKVNQHSFRGFAAGEVLFLGASGSKRGDEDWEISYRFAASENVAGLAIGDITGINKKGWEYLWLFFEEATDESLTIMKPIQCNIEKVYEVHNFANLMIGV